MLILKLKKFQDYKINMLLKNMPYVQCISLCLSLYQFIKIKPSQAPFILIVVWFDFH